MSKHNIFFDDLFQALPELWGHHNPHGAAHKALSHALKGVFKDCFGADAKGEASFGPFGPLKFPYHEMGAISSLDLFGLDELIIFSYYYFSRNRYKRVADIGGNIGLHSVLLSKCGYEVRCFEPDPNHTKLIRNNLDRNSCSNVDVVEAAVSDEDGTAEFVRVLGNTTGSHLSGAKGNPYGELNRFEVKVLDIAPIIQWADFIKLDAEGHESRILLATDDKDWQGTDAIVEIGTADNASAVYEHFSSHGVNMFAQKNNWQRVDSREGMPESYKDGSLFISANDEMQWWF